MSGCSQATISDECFAQLGSLRTVDIINCPQFTVKAYEHLLNVQNVFASIQSSGED
jgi:hypothetical protein